ncbi:hypothetical protein M3P05_16525, partial [Sansalvadorimonas sp. 2012CJ34-2]
MQRLRTLSLTCLLLALMLCQHSLKAEDEPKVEESAAESEILKSVPNNLFLSGYIEQSPSPNRNRLTTLLSEIVIPSGLAYLTSYGFSYAG